VRSLFWILLVIYVCGFGGVFALNAAMGNITLPLALLRAFLWPIWVATGWPHGTPVTMDWCLPCIR